MFDIYKPSGSIGTLTYPLAIGAVVIAVLLAFVYQLLLDWIPFIYVSALLTVGLGMGLGIMAAFIVRIGHCRNIAMAGLLGLTLATVGLGAKYWFQHQLFVNTVSIRIMEDPEIPADMREDQVTQFRKDFTLFEHLEMRVDEGWNVGRRGNGAPLNGIFVYLIWLIEAGIVYYFCWKQPTAAAAEPYSEKMSQWADEAEAVMALPITSEEMVQKIQSASSVDDLLEIPIPETDQSNRFAVYTVNSIPGQELEDAYLSVTSIEYSVNKKGEQETQETSLVECAVLSSEQRKQLVENAELLQEALAEFGKSKMQEEIENAISENADSDEA